MKIIFIGKVNFSKTILLEIINRKIMLSGVVTSNSKGINSDHVNLSKISKKNKIPTLVTKNINSISAIKWISDIQPDLILCIGWSQILRKEIIDIPKLYTIGYHPTNLPENRGRHPLIWSLVLGLKNMVSTYFIISERVDYGHILSKRKVLIKKSDNAGSMYLKLEKVASNQIISIINKIKKNNLVIKPIGNSKGNIWRRRYNSDGKVDWRMTANAIHNLTRALNFPYDGAYFVYKEKKYTLIKTKIIKLNKENIEPGKVIMAKNRKPIIKCGHNSIQLIETKPRIYLRTNEYL